MSQKVRIFIVGAHGWGLDATVEDVRTWGDLEARGASSAVAMLLLEPFPATDWWQGPGATVAAEAFQIPALACSFVRPQNIPFRASWFSSTELDARRFAHRALSTVADLDFFLETHEGQPHSGSLQAAPGTLGVAICNGDAMAREVSREGVIGMHALGDAALQGMMVALADLDKDGGTVHEWRLLIGDGSAEDVFAPADIPPTAEIPRAAALEMVAPPAPAWIVAELRRRGGEAAVDVLNRALDGRLELIAGQGQGPGYE